MALAGLGATTELGLGGDSGVGHGRGPGVERDRFTSKVLPPYTSAVAEGDRGAADPVLQGLSTGDLAPVLLTKFHVVLLSETKRPTECLSD